MPSEDVAFKPVSIEEGKPPAQRSKSRLFMLIASVLLIVVIVSLVLIVLYFTLWHKGDEEKEAKTTFLVVGDWGTYPDQTDQKRVAEQMGLWAEREGCDFILSVGDNFYPDGVESNSSSRFDSSWRNVYNHKAIADKKWYVVLGNHDYGGNNSERFQVEFSQSEPRWELPSLWYSFEHVEHSLQFVAVDTEALLEDKYDNQEQLAWLDNTLAGFSGKWRFVFGHRSPLSAAKPGDAIVHQEVSPLLEKYGVDFFIAGHDHGFQYITKEGNPGGVHYVISGGGGSKLTPFQNTSHQGMVDMGYSLDYYAESFGFATFEVAGDSVTVTFVDDTGMKSFERVRSKS